jgi:hypothetical protein
MYRYLNQKNILTENGQGLKKHLRIARYYNYLGPNCSPYSNYTIYRILLHTSSGEVHPPAFRNSIQSSRVFTISIFDSSSVSAAMNVDIAHFCLRKQKMLFSI